MWYRSGTPDSREIQALAKAIPLAGPSRDDHTGGGIRQLLAAVPGLCGKDRATLRSITIYVEPPLFEQRAGVSSEAECDLVL